MGTLYYGDNLDILRRYLKDETQTDCTFYPAINGRAIIKGRIILRRNCSG